MSGEEKRVKRLASPKGGSGAQAPVDPDRVWMTLERKYRVAEYESLTVNLGAATTLHPGESVQAGAKRLFGELRGEFNDVLEVMREQESVWWQSGSSGSRRRRWSRSPG